MFSVVTLSVKQTIIDDHKRRYEVDQFTRRQHTEIWPRVSTSVAITVYKHVCQGNYLIIILLIIIPFFKSSLTIAHWLHRIIGLHTYKLPRRTAQQILARKPGITTGFSTGKKLPHATLSGWKQLHQAYNPAGIHQMAPLEHTSINRPTTHLSNPEG